MDAILSLPVIGYLLMPSLTSYSTSLNVLFFYMVSDTVERSIREHALTIPTDMEYTRPLLLPLESRISWHSRNQSGLLPSPFAHLPLIRFLDTQLGSKHQDTR